MVYTLTPRCYIWVCSDGIYT